MRIIEAGIKPDDRVLRAQCRACETLFEFNTGEADRHHLGDYRDGEFWQIKCPVCESTVTAYPANLLMSYESSKVDQ